MGGCKLMTQASLGVAEELATNVTLSDDDPRPAYVCVMSSWEC